MSLGLSAGKVDPWSLQNGQRLSDPPHPTTRIVPTDSPKASF